jgi:hypothetical protein
MERALLLLPGTTGPGRAKRSPANAASAERTTMRLPSARTTSMMPGARIGLFAALMVACTLMPGGVHAGTVDGQPPHFLRFSVQDPDGKFFPHGEVELCLHGGNCVYADIDRGYPGQFIVPGEKLVPNGLYQVLVYDPDVDVVYEMRDWRYDPADFDPGYDILLDADKFNVYAQFRGKAGGGLTFEVANTLNPAWEERAGRLRIVAADSLLLVPRLVGRAVVPFMLGGHFKDDTEAAGGVNGVDPGLGVALAWRSHYPHRIDTTERWLPFHEVTLAWDGNRYRTDQVLAPGRESDVFFHRLTVGYGIGRLSPAGDTQVSLSVVAGAGAVLDGTELLRYRGREYRMFGAGARLVAIREVAAGRGVRIGLCGVVEAMRWWAQPVETDHWYGLAPSAALGVAFY